MEKTIQFSIEIKMTRLADLLCSGFEGGIGYWGRIEKFIEPSKPIDLSIWEDDPVLGTQVYSHIHYPLSPDGAVIIKDIEGAEGKHAKKYMLDMMAIKRGLKVFSEKCPGHFGDWLSENDDATTGDVFIQCCIFGEVLYG